MTTDSLDSWLCRIHFLVLIVVYLIMNQPFSVARRYISMGKNIRNKHTSFVKEYFSIINVSDWLIFLLQYDRRHDFYFQIFLDVEFDTLKGEIYFFKLWSLLFLLYTPVWGSQVHTTLRPEATTWRPYKYLFRAGIDPNRLVTAPIV